MTQLQIPKLTGTAYQLADQARETASRAGARGPKAAKVAQALAWRARWADVQAGRTDQAQSWLEALAILGAPGAIAALVVDADPDAIPSDGAAMAPVLVPQLQAAAA